MKNKFLFLLTEAFILSSFIVNAQEFAITNDSSSYASGVAYDGINYLMTMYADSTTKKVSAQLFNASGTLVGDRITIGTGGFPRVAFDGTNYLVVWHQYYHSTSGSAGGETTGNVYGQFVSTSGNLVGSSFTAATGVSSRFYREASLAFNDTTYFLAYATGIDNEGYTLYGQRISKSGTLLDSPVLISSLEPREVNMAYDGTNYLVIWDEDTDGDYTASDIYGQFVSKTGALVGSNFAIDDDDYASDNPTSIAFDGSRYLVSFHDASPDNGELWNLYARFVSTSGTVSDRVVIADTTQHPTQAMVAYDGTNYLATWIITSGKFDIVGRYFSTSGAAIDSTFTLFEYQGNRVSMGGVSFYTKDGFFIGVTKESYENGSFVNGDVYGMFLKSTSTGVSDIKTNNKGLTIYPNPVTDAFIASGFEGTATLSLSDIYGRLLFIKEITVGETIPVNSLHNGVYIVTIKSKDSTETEKLIIHR